LEISSINLIKVLSSSRLHFSCSRSTSNGNISVDLQWREETDHEWSELKEAQLKQQFRGRES
jgi:hypothetical protein